MMKQIKIFSAEFRLLEEMLDTYKNIPGSLITVLQKAQEIYGYLPTEVLSLIADGLEIPVAKVFGVASFYTQFKDGQTTPDGLFTLKNVACLGCCSLSPVMMVNEDTYGSLTPDKTKKILQKLRELSA